MLQPPMAAELRRESPSAADVQPLPSPLRAQARIHGLLLEELTRCDLHVVHQRIGLTPLRKLWAAWRAAR
jgi:phytoene/squalene synthetase